MTAQQNRVYLKFSLFLAGILLVAFLMYTQGWARIFFDRRALIAFVESFDNARGVLILIGIQIMQVMVAPVPGEVTGFVGGYLFGTLAGLAYSTIGLTLGSVGAFLLSRRFGRPFVVKVAPSNFLEKYDFLVDHRGRWISFFLFLIPGFPKDLLCYLLGTSHMKFGTFLLVSTVGRSLGTLLLSVSGGMARDHEYKFFILLLSVAAIALLLSYVYREKWISWLRRHRHSGHGPRP